MLAGDRFIILLLSIIILYWIYRMVRKSFVSTTDTTQTMKEAVWSIEPDDHILMTKAVELLEEAGYRVLTEERVVPLTFNVNGSIQLSGMMIIDHFVEDDEGIYVVKVAEGVGGQSFALTADMIQDELLPYVLLYPEAVGAVYVDIVRQAVHRIELQRE